MWQEGDETPLDDISDQAGDELQKLSVLQTLPTLLAGDPQACIQRLMPKMQQTLPTASTEFHVAASSTFKTILEQKLVSHSTFTQTFLQSILNSLDSRDPIVAQAWLETLLDVIELLPTEVIKKEILPTVANKGQLSQPVNSRLICCKLVGKICTRFDSQLIKKKVLPTVQSLCQDVNSNVRACICLQLRFVAEGLGPESLKSALLPSIVELASDEESIVRHASIQTIVYLLPQLQPDVIQSTISPLIQKSCDGALKSDDSVMCVIAQEFGKLAVGLEKCLTASEKSWLINYYQQLSQVGLASKKESTKQDSLLTVNNPQVNERYVECRQLCAFNVPAMFLFASTTAEGIESLLPTIADLTGDPFYLVRRTVAAGIHEVAKILGPKAQLIKGELIKLLKDDNVEVLQCLIPHIGQTLELLVQSQAIGTEQVDTSVMELGRALLKCEGEIFTTNNWRLLALLFEQLEILPKCFPSDYIYTHFVPVSIDRALNARPMPVRLAAGRTFLVFIRYNLKPVQQNELRNKLYSEFARNRSCYVRMLFIRMMIEAMSIFSSIYFKEYFYSTVLSLTEDPIANIRFKVVTLLPTFKSYLRLPSDKKLLANFEANLRTLINNEKDRDVLAALTGTIRQLDEIDIRHEGQQTTKLSKEDSDDMRKYKEEKKLQSAAPGKSVSFGQLAVPKKPIVRLLSTTDGGPSKNRPVVSAVEGTFKTISASTKAKPGVSMSLTDSTLRASRQTGGTSRSFDLAKASTSSNSLTSSWARLTSNSMLLTHLWEKIDQPDPNLTNAVYENDEYLPCDCFESSSFIYPSPVAKLDYKSCSACSCFNTNCSQLKDFHLRHNFFDTSTLTSPLRLTQTQGRHDYLHSYLLPRDNIYDDGTTKKPNITALRALTSAAHYNSCWAFSSMPEIPVTLLDDEFLVDTGVRIPAQLSSSQSTSKIPNLQDIIYRNTRIGNVNKSRRYSVNLDKNKSKPTGIYYPAASVSQRGVVSNGGAGAPTKSNRLSMNYEDRSKCQLEDDLKAKRSFVPRAKSRLSFDAAKTAYKPPMLDKRPAQPRVDKTKRHSASYSSKPAEFKDNKQRFKRHSLEVTDYSPIERANRLKKNFTLDVNHNQGSSRIPLRNSAASGSRTAPVTRASSPIRLGPQLCFNRDSEDDFEYCSGRPGARFSSSDEEVDKLCIRFAYVDSEYMRDENPRKSLSKLPIWVPRKKS